MKLLNAVWTFYSSKKIYYVVYLKNDQINAGLVSTRDFFQKHNFTDLNLYICSVYKYTFN